MTEDIRKDDSMDTVVFGNHRDVHCEHCMTPVEVWEPLKTYNGRCCELYSDVLNLVYDEDTISFERLLKKSKYLRNDYPDIPDFYATMQEIYGILEDCGVINSHVRKPFKVIS